jgi:hypothetical protein
MTPKMWDDGYKHIVNVDVGRRTPCARTAS